MSRPRTACTDCSLPFYTDENDSCPYCGTAGPTDARAAPGRERVTCADCGLPHYGDDCPYCARADGGPDVGEGTATEETAETATEPAAEAHREPARERVTCPECGLDHYADSEACPYCAMATANAASSPEVEPEAAAEPEAEPEPEAGAESEAAPEAEPAAESEAGSDRDTPPPVQRREERRQSDSGSQTVVGRFLGAVRSLFGR